MTANLKRAFILLISPIILLISLHGQDIIPLPSQVVASPGFFYFSGSTMLNPNQNIALPGYLQTYLKQKQTSLNANGAKNEVIFDISNQGISEGYELKITPNKIHITGNDEKGLFYGLQSFIQLLQHQPLSNGSVSLPCQTITDQPRFGYRGIMLDAGRYFQPVSYIKELLDIMAAYKFNTFHWHLTEDQGWRVEIEKYPKLMSKAAWRSETVVGHLNQKPRIYDGTRHGGYYTKADIREIVAYAAERKIMVIPEIEMPGHATAAVAAYPELGCTGKILEVPTEWGVKEDVYCPSEATFKFLEDVLTEIIPLFPSPYIHIGGDECPKKQWKESDLAQSVMRREGLKNEDELQSYFIRRMEGFLKTKGKKLIGWDEILEGGLAPDATVMSWRGIKGGIEAAHQGHDVIMSPNTFCYLDYYQSDAPGEPLAIGGKLTVEKVYSFDPIPDELPAETHKHILGGQGNIWTEYIATLPKLRYMAYSRMLALSEVLWTPMAKKAFLPFALRLNKHIDFWKTKNIEFANHLFEVKPALNTKNEGLEVSLTPLVPWGEIRYTLDGTLPKNTSPVYTLPILLSQKTMLTAQSFLQGESKGSPVSVDFMPHAGLEAKILAVTPPSRTYKGAGERGLINGISGKKSQFNDGEWQGITPGENFSLKLSWSAKQSIKGVQFQLYHDPESWIYLPSGATLFSSEDGITFQKACETAISENKDTKVLEVEIPCKLKTKYIELKIPATGIIPSSRPGAGNQGWLFLDEVRIN
ncbi:MAG: family 20 glycosylhydrolase [Bacteroidetes bacterium]|nr:family 20 glycosylhydrolase [Bacteroidota bacterium]